MTTREITQTVYTFDSLPTEAAKEAARDWWRSVDNDPTDITESIEEAVTTAARLLGITIDPRRGSRQLAIWWGVNPIEGAFDGSWSSAKRPPEGFGAAIRAEFPTFDALHRIADALDTAVLAVRNANPDGSDPGACGEVYATVSTGRGCDMSVAVRVDMDDLDAVPPDDTESIVSGCLEEFGHWIGTLADGECDHRNSADYIDDTLTANGYEFFDDGSRAP